MFSDPSGKIRKATEYVSVSRDQLFLASFDVRECAETVNLQFIDKRSESKGSMRRKSRMGRRFRGNITKVRDRGNRFK
jgi:hypothetical protein